MSHVIQTYSWLMDWDDIRYFLFSMYLPQYVQDILPKLLIKSSLIYSLMFLFVWLVFSTSSENIFVAKGPEVHVERRSRWRPIMSVVFITTNLLSECNTCLFVCFFLFIKFQRPNIWDLLNKIKIKLAWAVVSTHATWSISSPVSKVLVLCHCLVLGPVLFL